MEKKVEVEKKCKIAGCKRPYRAKGYCTVHYNKWRKGELESKKGRYKICGEENCKKPSYKKGMCEQHYGAWSASKKKNAGAEAPAATPAAEQSAG